MIELAVLVCDVLLVPIKTSIYDTAAILPMLEIARDRRKPFTFVLSDVDTRHKVLNAEVRATLKTLGPLWSGQHLAPAVLHRRGQQREGGPGDRPEGQGGNRRALGRGTKRLASQPQPAPRRGEGRANV